MTSKEPHILLLAGTFEARSLAKKIEERFPNIRITASFAGVVRDLPDLGVPTRIGGFGGVDGLVAFARAEGVSAFIDATHPFAAQMSRNAFEAASRLGLPLLRLERPAWSSTPEDTWKSVLDMNAAANFLPAGSRAFLAVGRKEISAFYHRTDLIGIARMIEPPPTPLPDGWSQVLSRPPQDPDAEVSLFSKHGITHVVAKNSGGTRAYAKIEAARRLNLPVVMIERPVLPKTNCASTVSKLMVKLGEIIAGQGSEGAVSGEGFQV